MRVLSDSTVHYESVLKLQPNLIDSEFLTMKNVIYISKQEMLPLEFLESYTLCLRTENHCVESNVNLLLT